MKRLIVAASLLAAGCVSAPKKMASDPAAAPPEAFTASSESGPAVSGEWWKDFLQPGLEETVAAALERNYDLRAAAARVGQAAARARIAGADLKPSIGASFGGARRRQNFVGLPIPGTRAAFSPRRRRPMASPSMCRGRSTCGAASRRVLERPSPISR